MKPLFTHVVLLGLASASALYVWTRSDDEKKKPAAVTAVEVWGGSPETLESVSFESATRKVKIEPRKDANGRFYAVTVDKDEVKAPPRDPHDPRDPHEPPGPRPGPSASASAAPGASGKPGASAAPPTSASAPSPSASASAGPVASASEPQEKKHETSRFVSVKAGEELAKKLAPLVALRAVGKVEGSRAEEFGLDKPEGTLKVRIGGKEHSLVIGGSTPGGQERYAKLSETGAVYAVPGDIAQSMLYAESRLIERQLHAFVDADVTKIKLSKGTKSRDAVRVPEKKDGWADATAPTKLDETIGNYISKLGRLSVQEYVENPSTPLRPEDAVARVDYYAGTKPLGFLELFKIAGEKNDFLARTENGRWFTKVSSSAAEQVEHDLPGVLK